MKKNIFTLLAKKKALVISVALALTLGLSALIIILCLPDSPPDEPPKPPVEKTYVVSFETNGGSAVDAVEVKENSAIVLENYVTTKQDSYFYAWCTDAELTQRASATVTITADTTFYAEWGVEELYLLIQ